MSASFVVSFRALGLLLVLVFVNSAVLADAGSRYLVGARLEMKDGSVKKGYFNFGSDSHLLNRDQTGFYYDSRKFGRRMRFGALDSTALGLRPGSGAYHLGGEVFFLAGDSVDIFSDARVIYSSSQDHISDLVAAMLGPVVRIAKSQISRIFVKSIQEIVFITKTGLMLEDQAWIKFRPVFQEHIGVLEICYFDVLSFNQPGVKALALLEELRKVIMLTEYDTLALKQQSAIIEKLRQEKVIVFYMCSC